MRHSRASERWARLGLFVLSLATAGTYARAVVSADTDPAAAAPYRAPYTPVADAEVLQQVPAETDPAVVQLRALRVQLDAAPMSLAAASQLARAYINFGRQVGDAHYAGYAEAVIAPWLKEPEPPVAALVIQATILQYRHEFTAARTVLKQALARDDHDVQGWLTLATLDMVQGDYKAAAAGCAQVGSTGGPTLGAVCSGNLQSYLGQAQQSIDLLKQIERNIRNPRADFEAWIEGLLAESAERLGDWPEAESHYRRALAATPRDNYLLVAYADFLLDRGRPQEVLRLLADQSQSDTAFLRLALAQAALESPQVARYTWIMAARFAALAQRGSDFYGREQVRFALQLQHDPQGALVMAQRNWQAQRAPWDVRVFLEAAQAAHQPQAAVEVLEFVSRTRLQDPIIAALVTDLQAQISARAGATR